MNMEEEKEQEESKKTRSPRRFATVAGFLFGVFFLSAGLYTAWTAYYDNDLIEPFACSYQESAMHAREVHEAMENIAYRTENFEGDPGTFFSGNMDYGYYVKLTSDKGGKIYSNISDKIYTIFDKNIRSWMYTIDDDTSESETSDQEESTAHYYDLYRWDAQSDKEVVYQEHGQSRVEVPKVLLTAKKIDKVGICFSEEVMQEKENAWNVYATYLLIMAILMLLGVIFMLYFGTKLFSDKKIPDFLNPCFAEIPVILILLAAFFMYQCYERKISLFAVCNQMVMLSTQLGMVQLILNMLAGAAILTCIFSVLFLGMYLLLAVFADKQNPQNSFLGTVYKNYGGKQKPLAAAFAGIVKAWKLVWGMILGTSLKGSTIAQRERKRTLFFGIAFLLCIIAMVVSYRGLSPIYAYRRVQIKDKAYFYCSFVLLIFVTAVYLIGTIRNVMDYAVMERLLQKVYEGNYQKVGETKETVSKQSVCFSDVEKLEQIGNGFQKAVEDQLHAERMKIELLTNVSHDLKTPLTSIISYIELLDMETDLSPEAREYVLVLKKKAERLKTIISEVFELAKTTSGEIQIEKTEIDFYRLVVQTLADMQDRIDASGLKIKQNLVQENVIIYSDGERMYRVLQNLIDNALKYSMQGTRIYLELVSQDGIMTFTIKNIAGYEMDFNAGDITERFVRGDKNRTTEGSGLGLSIAQSFTIACGGEFSVAVDGDMFKVMIRFPVVCQALERAAM